VDPTELIPRAKAGEALAIDRLLAQYRSYLRLLARVYMDNLMQAKADPSDLVQETCLQACRDFHQFRGTTEKELIGWLRRIMAHTGDQFVRQYKLTKQRDVRLERQLHDVLDQSAAALDRLASPADSSPSRQAVRREVQVILADSIARLPDEYREATILHHLEGKSLAEVADRLGRSVSSVNSLLARALVRLRVEIDGDQS
jgi:RNA polymerase sigma-70 factor (ECF subfamily)